MKYLSNAKINLNLMIQGIDDQGYHLLYSVVAPVELYDELDFEFNGSGDVSLECNNNKIPTDDKNIIIKCIKELKKIRPFSKGLNIKLTKNIPIEAGLGGGSSNGATTLLALNEMLNLDLTKEELVEIGLKVGADIPFFIYNRLALMEGRGEKLTLLNNNEFKPYILLIKPNQGVSTKEAFYLYDNMIKTKEYTPPILHKLIEENEVKNIKELIKNDLERTAKMLVPEIEKISEILVDLGVDASCMSGSGSCCFGLFFDKQKAIEAYEKVKDLTYFVKLTKIL